MGESMRSLTFALLLGVLCFLPHSISGEKKKHDLAAERGAAFAWMAKLDYPDTKDPKFVLVATGRWSQHGNAVPENRYRYGFLLEEQGNKFKVLSLDLNVLAFEKSPPKTKIHEVVDYEVLDLNKEALAWLWGVPAGQ